MRDNPDRPELPLVLQHAVVSLVQTGRARDLSSAFAIATASLQRAGILIPGTNTLSAYGMKVEQAHRAEAADVLASKRSAYENALRRKNEYEDDDDGSEDGAIYLLIEEE